MNPMQKAMLDSEELRLTLPKLRNDTTKSGQIRYNQTLLDVLERQHNMYTRLMLMDDPESRDVAAQMQKVAEDYMGKSRLASMNTFFETMKKDINFQLNLLSKSDRGWIWAWHKHLNGSSNINSVLQNHLQSLPQLARWSSVWARDIAALEKRIVEKYLRSTVQRVKI